MSTTTLPTPTAPLMSFPSPSGSVVEVSTTGSDRTPYRWQCSAGHDGNHAYASLPFCRDDARAHAVECPGAAPTAPLPQPAVDALRKLELALTTPDAATVAKVGHAFGFRAGWKPNPHLGETATYLTAWSQMELDEIFERVGGTVTSRQVERAASDGSATWTATEITLTVQVPGVGPVEVVTDIEDDPEHGFRTDIPVVAVARYQSAAEHCRDLAESADFDGCLAAQDEMAMCRCQLEQAGRLDLIGGDV